MVYGTMEIDAVAPGAIFYRVPFPEGVPIVESPRSRQCWALGDSQQLASVPERERSSLLASLKISLQRALYHQKRFKELRGALEDRRAHVPGEVFFDSFVSFLHYELQAYCGAVRLLVDELCYITARRHGTSRGKAARWEPRYLMGKDCPRDRRKLPEVAALRKENSWYRTLNTYRNAFFHHGWRHGSGHGDPTEAGSIARYPARNALIVPDQSSVKSHGKPHDWTWNKGTTVDDVLSSVSKGLDRVLDRIFGEVWATPVPPAGRIPIDEQPNMLVALAKPWVLIQDKFAVIPLFGSRDAAEKLEPRFQKAGADTELCRVPVSTSVIGTRAVSISVAGIKHVPGVEELERLDVILDPDLEATSLVEMRGRARWIGRMEEVLEKKGSVMPMNVPVGDDLSEVFLWRHKVVHDWS